MATEGELSQGILGENSNGDQHTKQGQLSNADALRRKHEAEEAHKPTVEDVIDEEDILHPPPSASQVAGDADGASSEKLAATPMSAKAAGKQKARSESPGTGQSPEQTKPALNMDSHEAFPELGSGPQPRAPRPVTTAWTAKKPSAAGAPVNGVHPASNGLPGRALPGSSSNNSSRASTPASSGVATPRSLSGASMLPNHSQPQRSIQPQAMSIPGRYTERISLLPQEMRPRSQLKKPIPDVLRELNRRSKANVQMSSGAGGAVHFDAKGPVDAVRQALKEVARELGSKQSVKVSVPASVRPHIIGKQGATVQAISQRTGAHIQIPKPSDSAGVMGEDDDTMIDVVIEGDSVAAAMARREIENLVDERTSSVNFRLRDIPAEFYPFLAGPHNCRVSALEEGKDIRIHIPHHVNWSDQPPQQAPSSGGTPVFAPTTGNPILISGDRLAAQAARAEIMKRAQELRNQLTSSELDINRGRHQFVIGEKGTSLHDFLQETGCAVILPPATQDTETITIVGPPENIENGINKVTDLATSMQMTNLDIARLHPHAPSGPSIHARDLARYLRQRRELERLEKLYDAHILLPATAEGPLPWEIYSREGKNLLRARTEIVNIVNGHPPARLSHVDIDPFYHEHLKAQSPKTLMNEHGVYIIYPQEDEETPDILLIYEGQNGTNQDYEIPKRQPSPEELQQFERALQGARQHLISLVNQNKKIISRRLAVPRKFHDKVGRFVNREQQNLPPGELPVQIRIGGLRTKAAQPGPTQKSTSNEGLEEEVTLRGHEENVNSLAEKILRFVVEEEENERERGHVMTFDFPQKFSNYLIGRKGDNIRKYREEFDVDIQVHDGKVDIKGPKVKAEAAKARILALGKKLEDEATHVLKIHPQYHKDLIGPKGSQVNRLQERYTVRINFPKSAASSSSNDNHSVADSASEVGGAHKNRRASQEPDQVIVKGPRKHADEARDELLSLLQWTIDNSHTATVSVSQDQIPKLIGQGGREMEKVRMSTGAQIDVPDVKKDFPNASGRVAIKLKGTKKQVDEAKRLFEERAKIFDETVSRTIEVDKRHHKSLIGSGGANIRDIVIKAGGPDDRSQLARMVRFPRAETEGNSIRVEGDRAVVDKIIESIEEAVRKMETEVVKTIDVPPQQHRILIGRGGETRRGLESEFNVNINIPRQAESGPTQSGIKISGQPENVANAKARIQEMVKTQEGESIQVPRRIHHTLSDNGQLFRRLKSEYKVNVDHGGQKPPPRPAAINPRANNNNNESMPLITDPDSNNDDKYSWQIHNLTQPAEEGGVDDEEGATIPWILHGPSPSAVTQARERILSALESAAHDTSAAGYLILPDPRSYRFVIGAGGAQVNSLRDQTGCKINVPRAESKGEAIEITGPREKVEETKDRILEIVKEAEERGNSSGGGRGRGSRMG
ncbi:MAG: hypothetical protein M1816_004521 [Peltula sp. TS41687]|nr:MAG: hypothetical protein M1816_004521 [Peltula sp. TS41687]